LGPSRRQELTEAGAPGLVEDDVDHGGPLTVGFVDDLSFTMDSSQDVTAVEGDEELDNTVGHAKLNT
jgi:hypothetical protein